MPDNVSNLNLAKGSASPAEFAISCRGVTKPIAAARRKLPRGIDLEVKRGELLMIVGPSGCGKTTLISVIATILGYDSGQCHVLGLNPKRMDDKESASSFNCSTCCPP